MLKRIFASFVVMLILVSVCSCGDNNNNKLDIDDIMNSDPIVWVDNNIESACRQFIMKPTGDIYPYDLVNIKEIYLGDNEIIIVVYEEEYEEEFNGMASLLAFTNEDKEKYKQYKFDENNSSISDFENFTELRALGFFIAFYGDLYDIKNIPRLTSLCFYSTKISEIGALEDCVNLKVLSFIDNNIEDVSVISNFKSLQALFLSKNRIDEINIDGEFPDLEILEIDDNEIKNLDGLITMDMPMLKKLSMNNNLLEDISAFSEMNLPELEELYLKSNYIDDLSALTNLVKIETLDLRDNMLSDSSLSDWEPVAYIEEVLGRPFD